MCFPAVTPPPLTWTPIIGLLPFNLTLSSQSHFSAFGHLLVTDFFLFGRQRHYNRNNIKSSQSPKKKTLSRIGGSPFVLNPPNLRHLQFLRSRPCCFFFFFFFFGPSPINKVQRHKSDVWACCATLTPPPSGPLGVLNNLHLSPCLQFPQPLHLLQPFFTCAFLYRIPISGTACGHRLFVLLYPRMCNDPYSAQHPIRSS